MLRSKHGRLALTLIRGMSSKEKKVSKAIQRVCIIGAGPSGMNLVGTFNKLKEVGKPVEVTCYEKQAIVGGMWNFTWRTGVDEFGEPVHCSQYQDLFSNGPKECLEIPDYTFMDHFGKNTPSFMPRQALLDYLRGYWKYLGVKDRHIKTNYCVRDVKYDRHSKLFTVRANDQLSDKDEIKKFDHLVVATGHYSTPNYVQFGGLDHFKGRILHAHDFRNAREFRGQKVLIIGSSFSGEDVALQCYKFGAAKVAISHFNPPMMFKWPEGIREIPLLIWADGNVCHFEDGTTQKFDAIIMCTGYKHHFPFMSEGIRLSCGNVLFPPNLYQGLQWHGVDEFAKNANGRLFYMAMQNLCYTFPMFMLQSLWISYVIKGLLQTPPYHYCVEEIKKYQSINKDLDTNYKQIDAQTAYIQRLAKDIGYGKNLDASKIYYEWEWDKLQDILTYRDKSYTSMHTGHTAPSPKIPWLKCYDDSIAHFLGD